MIVNNILWKNAIVVLLKTRYHTLHMQFQDVEHFKSDTGYDIEDFGWVPRVTSIVGIKAKPALYRFYANLKSFDEGEKIKEQSATEGTLVHETIQDILTGKPRSIENAVRPAVQAALDFVDKHNIVIDPEYVEKRLVNYDDRYAGTMDALATIDGRLGVLDIKTSQAIYRDYDLQTSAYMAALTKDLPNLEARWILRVDQHRLCHKCSSTLRVKGGNEKLRLAWDKNDRSVRARANACEHEWSEIVGDVELKESPNWEIDYKAFEGAKKLWEWEHEHWLKQVGYL
jgi:hypothetical protein